MPRRISVASLPPNARNAALRALLMVDSGMFAQRAVTTILPFSRDCRLSVPDARLGTELFYGVLRTEIRLDFLLSKILTRLQKLPPAIRLILRIGVYSLLFQDRVPDHAAVHAAVEQARLMFSLPFVRLVNAVLRGIQRMGDAPYEPQFYVTDKVVSEKKQLSALSMYYSLPLLVAEIWEHAYGRAATLALMKRSFERPWTGLRVNSRNLSAEELENALLQEGAHRLAPNTLAFPAGDLPTNILNQPLYFWRETGALNFQSAGSQIVLDKLGFSNLAECAWWDACAGYGGKTLALLERGISVTLCTDVSFSRLSCIFDQCAVRELPQPNIVQANMLLSPLRYWEGNILLDVPCSGLGVLARRPDLRRGITPQRLAEYASLQSSLLRQAAKSVLPGRYLAYITCTLNPSENQAQITNFLSEHSDYFLAATWQTPWEHPWMEGMFGALLQRS